MPDGAVEMVADWLSLRGRKAGALVCPIRKGGEIQYRAMSPVAVLLILQKRAEEAGVDIVTVQKLAGHASVTTTAKYDRRGEETKRKAVQRLSLS